MGRQNLERGRYGEDLAVWHLERMGLTVVSRNWRCRIGEIDIVAMDDNAVVVCEVKTRRTEDFGSPLADFVVCGLLHVSGFTWRTSMRARCASM